MSVRIYAPELYPRKPQPSQVVHDDYIRAHAGIDAALIAADLGVTEMFVQRRQRKLGLRRIKHAPRKADRERAAREGW